MKETSVEADILNKMMPNVFIQCHPISNLEDLETVIKEPPKWVQRVEALMSRSSFVVQNVISDCHSEVNHFLPRQRLDVRTVPKTLVCHDYKGGYQGDKYIHKANEEILGNGYTFYNWSQIDIFVYFSHYFITIPPLCWINIAHQNGVKVLGTLITEFDSGSDICDKKIFKSIESMEKFAKSLAQLTKIFGFDGWLLNIENKIDSIDVLKAFVPFLTELLHEDNPANLVIWYDSVTEKGDLKWQNELNENNRFFFDSCDGIFLNYTWTEKHLINSAEAAKHRNLDVFVGIDIFGRNMYGGGKFNTYKAAEVATRYNLSMAFFAPGWTHETLEQTDVFFEQFFNRDSAFWCSLWPYLYTHPISYYFNTNFYIGLDKSCYNIFSQQQQLSKFVHPKDTNFPAYEPVITLKNKCDCIRGDILDTKNVCLITKENLRKDLEHIHHLFVCDIEISSNTVVYFFTKNISEQCLTSLNVTLIISGYNNTLKNIKLLSEKKETPRSNSSVLEVNPTESPDVLNNIRKKYSKWTKEEKWNLSVYIFKTDICEILEIGATLVNGNSLYLGAFGVENADGDFLKNV